MGPGEGNGLAYDRHLAISAMKTPCDAYAEEMAPVRPRIKSRRRAALIHRIVGRQLTRARAP